MNQNEVFEIIKSELDASLHGDTPAQQPKSLSSSVSPWLAASLLQKAIRRGETDWALAAADNLLQRDPDRLWRRLLIIAFEDVGIANLDLIARVTAASRYRRTYEKHGLARTALLILTAELCVSPKCRASDDLYVIIENGPVEDIHRLHGSELPLPDLLDTATHNSAPIEDRAKALWLAVGTERKGVATLSARRGQPKAVFDYLNDAGWPHSLVEVARVAYSRTGEVICAFMPLLYAVYRETLPGSYSQMGVIASCGLSDDMFPPVSETNLFEVPGYALDWFCREGRQSLSAFLHGPTETAGLIRQHIPPSQRMDALGSLLFRTESSLVRKRLDWSLGIELQQSADQSVANMFRGDAAIVFEQMRTDLATLNEIRAGR